MGRTWLERNEHSGVRSCFSSKRCKGFDLGMRLTASAMIPLGHNLPTLYDQGSDHWVWVRAPPPFLSEFQNPTEKPFLLLVVQIHMLDRLAQGEGKPDRTMIGTLPLGEDIRVADRSGEII